jgi:hypothetical protein
LEPSGRGQLGRDRHTGGGEHQPVRRPPTGNTTLSGTVVTTGNAPVANACVFLLSSSFVFQAITNSAGNWSLGGLPDSDQFAIGVVPPFVGTNGPCANDGPPPVSAPGELQPVFVRDGWIDLSDPALVGGNTDPFAYATARGATVFTTSTSGIQACLTTAPGNVVPRPACNQVTPTTTTTAPTTSTPTTDPATTTTAAASPTSIPRLPPVGTPTLPLGIAAAVLIAGGVIALAAARHPATSLIDHDSIAPRTTPGTIDGPIDSWRRPHKVSRLPPGLLMASRESR